MLFIKLCYPCRFSPCKLTSGPVHIFFFLFKFQVVAKRLSTSDCSSSSSTVLQSIQNTSLKLEPDNSRSPRKRARTSSPAWILEDRKKTGEMRLRDNISSPADCPQNGGTREGKGSPPPSGTPSVLAVESDDNGGVVLNGIDVATELADTRSNGECDSYSGDDDFCVLDENGCELLVFGGGGTGAADASTGATDLLPPPPPQTSVANTSVRRVACSKKRRLTETVSRRHSSVVAVAASTTNSFKPQRKSLDSDPEPFVMSDDAVLLPRLSLRRDVKNEKRISYTKTKITGELGGSSGSTLTTGQSQRRSAVVISLPTNGKSPPLQHTGGTAEAHLQNGGGGALSDCSTSTTDSERRFSERRFKGMPGRMNRSSAFCVWIRDPNFFHPGFRVKKI
jgi:hypothetical protein